MADWKAIKTEYITTNTSYRKLAEKYGISYQTICAKSKSEHWLEQREQHTNKTVTKTLERISEQQADRASRLQSVTERLLEKVERLMDMDDKMLEDSGGETCILGAKGMRSLSGVLKDIKDIQGVKSEADIQEQEARIAKLRREAEKDMGDTAGQSGIVYLPVIAPMPPTPEEDDG